jgi:hypothetical protein
VHQSRAITLHYVWLKCKAFQQLHH